MKEKVANQKTATEGSGNDRAERRWQLLAGLVLIALFGGGQLGAIIQIDFPSLLPAVGPFREIAFALPYMAWLVFLLGAPFTASGFLLCKRALQ